MRGEEDVVVSGVRVLGKLIWSEGASKMVAAACGDVDGSAYFFILNIAAGCR